MSKIKCSSCGEEIDSKSNFCEHCGNKISHKPSLLDKIINFFKSDKNHDPHFERFVEVRKDIKKFNEEFLNKEYFSNSLKEKIKKDNKNNYSLCLNLEKNHKNNKFQLNDDDLSLIELFINNFENIDKIVKKINKKHIDVVYNEFKNNKNHYQLIVDESEGNIQYNKLITTDKKDLKKDYDFVNDLLKYETFDNYDFGNDSKLMKEFVEVYQNFDKIKNKVNEYISRKEVVRIYNKHKTSILKFIDKFHNNISEELYINDYEAVLKNYRNEFDICTQLSELPKEYHSKEMSDFLDIYDNFKENSQKINANYLKKKYEIFLNYKTEISHEIDKYQNISIDDYLENKEEYLEKYSRVFETLQELKDKNYSFEDDSLVVNNFFNLYNNFNGEFSKLIYSTFLNYKFLLTKFLNKYGNDRKVEGYIFDKNDILKTYFNAYEKTLDVFKLSNSHEIELNEEEKCKINKFINLYDNFDSYIEKNNKCYVKSINEKFSHHRNAILEFIGEFNVNNFFNYYIEDKNKLEILKINKKYYDLVCEMNNIPGTTNDITTEFSSVYDNFDNIIYNMNKNYVNNLYELNEIKIDEYVSIVNLKQDYYISNSKLNTLLDDYDSYFNIVINLLEYCSEHDYLPNKTKLLEFPKNSDELIHIVNDANESFIKRELINNKELFDNVVPGKPLDENQRRAVVIDEDNTQIIAGAGCGKTLTLQAKTKYLIEKQKVNPNEILAISFSNYSANDLKNKMSQIGLDIDVSTFHSLGLDILRKNNVKSKVSEYALKNAIKEYFVLKLIDDEVMLQKIIEFFGYYMYEPLDKNKVKKIGEIFDYERGMDLETLYSKFEKLKDPTLKKTSLKGEKVKSLEERRIANFLFINGINYTYEKNYEPKIDWEKTKNYLTKFILFEFEIPKNIKNNLINQILNFLELDEFLYWPNTGDEVLKYHPDFYLDDYDIYYEHFGVNRNCLAPWLPKRKSYEYKNEMRNKQLLHRKYGTKLIETYSYYQSENRLLNRLSEKLQQAGVKFKKFDYQKFMIDLLHDEEKINEYWDFIKLIETFINLFKGNGYNKEKFNEFRKINEENFTDFSKEKHELFLDIVEDIYDYYYEYLENHGFIDFNDMINNAVKKVETNGYYKNYKYIMVDEFQDTSHTRFNLLKTIKEYLNAKLIVVGDDWQSIYRFTGCDIDLFTNFENYFEDTKTAICYITNTYRNSQSLIDASGKFIMKNESQFKKELKSKANIQISDTIKLYQYLNYLEQPFVFEAIISDIFNSSNKKNINILVLGRNRKDYLTILHEDLFFTTGSLEDKNLKIHYKKNPKISISYMTVHGSKGLEEDNVVLINLKDKKNGFPNKIEDDSVLSFVKNEKIEPISFAEERRLFYVALTRTLKRTYLLAPKDKKSIFVSELMEDIEVIDFAMPDNEECFDGDEIRTIASTDGQCPDCGTGKINLKFNPKTGKKFFKCSNWPRCEWYGGNFYESLEELNNPRYCPKCGGLLVKKMNRITGDYFYSCINYFPNKYCRYSENIK